MALRWFRDQFYAIEAGVASAAGLDAYDLMTAAAERVPAGSEGLVVLPHLEGAACPELNRNARAVFFGATLRHTRAHFTRAILEAVAYMLRKNLEMVEQVGGPMREIRSTGGGARSRAVAADQSRRAAKTDHPRGRGRSRLPGRRHAGRGGDRVLPQPGRGLGGHGARARAPGTQPGQRSDLSSRATALMWNCTTAWNPCSANQGSV